MRDSSSPFSERTSIVAGETVPFLLPNGEIGRYTVAGVFDLGSSAANAIVADSLEKVYGEGPTATRAVSSGSFSMEQGEFASLIGQSGSGKSTLLNLLGLLYTPSSGSAAIGDTDTSRLNRKQLAALRGESIGFVFQFHHLLPEFSVFENMTMPIRINGGSVGEEGRNRVDELLELLGLIGLAAKNANQLSGGQK